MDDVPHAGGSQLERTTGVGAVVITSLVSKGAFVPVFVVNSVLDLMRNRFQSTGNELEDKAVTAVSINPKITGIFRLFNFSSKIGG